MANIVKLTVDKSTKTKEGNYSNKLIAPGETVQTAFGKVEGAKRTFYMFTDQMNEKGVEAELDLNDFDIVKREWDTIDEETQKEIKITITTLYPKR